MSLFNKAESLLLVTGLGYNELAEIIKKGQPYENSLERFGPRYLERYLIWKKYNELIREEKLKLPILPVIAAFPCIGKTTMAREIATAFGIGNVIGGDAFRSVLRGFIDKEKEPAFFVSVYKTWQLFGEKTGENILKGFYAQAKIVNRAMERLLVDRGIRDGESMIIEYLHFLPSQYYEDTLKHPSVIPVVLGIKDKEIWKERIRNRVRSTHLKGGAQRLLDAIDVYEFLQKNLEKEAKKYKIPIIYTDRWDEAVDDVISIIIEKIKHINSLAGKEIPKTKLERKIEEERTSAGMKNGKKD